MAIYHGPEIRDMSDTNSGELLTCFGGTNGEISLLCIRLAFNKSVGIPWLLVLKSSQHDDKWPLPYIVSADHLIDSCCSFGTSFHIQYRCSPTEIQLTDSRNTGSIVYLRGIQESALCYTGADKSACYVSLSSWLAIDKPSVGDFIIRIAKWRLIVVSNIDGVLKIRTLARFPSKTVTTHTTKKSHT